MPSERTSGLGGLAGLAAFGATLLLLSSGCAARKIPGTEIDDTSDTRAIIEVVDRYRRAVEREDIAALLALAHPAFYDDGGTSSADDDLRAETLEATLRDRFGKVEDIRLDISVRKVVFAESGDEAKVTYTYTLSFKMPAFGGRAKQETDIKQLTVRRGAGQADDRRWLLASGI